MKKIITKEECLHVLRRKFPAEDEFNFTYRIEPLSSEKLHGFLGEHYFLICTLNDEIQRNVSFFVKVKRGNNGSILAHIAENFHAFEKEIATYEMIQENLNLINAIPHKWIANYFGSINENVIIFEDLSTLGYTLARRPLLDLDYEHCREGLKAIAAMHAFSLTLEHRLPKGKQLIDVYPKALTDQVFNRDNEMIRLWMECHSKSTLHLLKYIPDLENQIHMSLTDFKKHLWKEYHQKASTAMKPSKIYKNVMTHGDVWGNNVLFRYENDTLIDCLLVDFQVTRYVPPCMDVLLFIMINTQAMFRRKYPIVDLLEFYYLQLMGMLHSTGLKVEEILPRKEFLESCMEFKGLTQFLSASYHLVLAMKNCDRAMDEEKFLIGDRKEYVDEEMELNYNGYRDKIIAHMEEFIDTVLEELKKVE